MPEINPYDAVHYAGASFPQTHPRRLATLATLFGMNPTPPAKCRVLEIGAGDGGNLIPMAQELPHSTFLGIDLAAAPIEFARARISQLKLRNISMDAMDLRDLPALPPFDYIIAHGVYSWVPDEVRDGMLEVIQRLLKPEGVAFVSYNALPGGHLRQMLREMMLFHLRGVEEPQERIDQARAFLEFIASAHAQSGPYQHFLKAEAEAFQSRSDFALFHDELGEHYHPVYFTEFIDHASEYGLQFLAEAEYSDMQDAVLFPEAAQTLRDLTDDDIILREQYLDYTKGRRFRQTLVVHQNLDLDHTAPETRILGMKASTTARRGEPGEFLGPLNAALRTSNPLALQIMNTLVDAAPRAVPVAEICKHLDAARILLAAYGARMIDLEV